MTKTDTTTEREATAKEWLWYVCLVCGSSHRILWELTSDQIRERRLTCHGECGRRTKHRLAGLPPARRKVDCPTWCSDHRTWFDGAEEHQRLLVSWQGWHEYLGRWDCTTVEIAQLEDRPDLIRKDQALPHINCNLSIAGIEKSRLVHALLGQALKLLSEA